MCKNASQRMTFFTEKALTLKAFFFLLQMGPRHLQWQESVLSEYIVGGGGKVTWGVEFKLWQHPKYFILWNADISKITIQRKSSRSNLGEHFQQPFPAQGRTLWWWCTENRVNLTSTSAPNLKHSQKKGQKIHQIHDDPRGPRKKKKKEKAGLVFFCLFGACFVTRIQKSMCSACIGGSWCVHCLQWSEHQKKGVNRKTARVGSGKSGHPIWLPMFRLYTRVGKISNSSGYS